MLAHCAFSSSERKGHDRKKRRRTDKTGQGQGQGQEEESQNDVEKRAFCMTIASVEWLVVWLVTLAYHYLALTSDTYRSAPTWTSIRIPCNLAEAIGISTRKDMAGPVRVVANVP